MGDARWPENLTQLHSAVLSAVEEYVPGKVVAESDASAIVLDLSNYLSSKSMYIPRGYGIDAFKRAQRILARCDENVSVNAVAQEFGVTHTTVYTILKNRLKYQTLKLKGTASELRDCILATLQRRGKKAGLCGKIAEACIFSIIDEFGGTTLFLPSRGRIVDFANQRAVVAAYQRCWDEVITARQLGMPVILVKKILSAASIVQTQPQSNREVLNEQ